RLWDPDSGRLLDSLPNLKGTIDALAFAPDGRLVALGSTDGTIHLWPVESVERPRTFSMGGGVTALALAPDDTSLYVGLVDGMIWRRSLTNSKIQARFERHAGAVTCMACSPQGDTLVSGGVDKALRLWHTPKPKPLYALKESTSRVTAVAFALDGRRMLSG